MFNNLFEVGSHDYRIHAAGAEVCDEQTDLNKISIKEKERNSVLKIVALEIRTFEE